MRRTLSIVLVLAVALACGLLLPRSEPPRHLSAPQLQASEAPKRVDTRAALLDATQPWFQAAAPQAPAAKPSIVLPIAERVDLKTPPPGSREVPCDIIDYLLVSQDVLRNPLPREHPFFGKHFEMIDLRPAEEFAKGHIPYSNSVPYARLAESLEKGVLSTIERGCLLVVYGSQFPSDDVAEALSRAGFQQVYFLSGGFNAWSSAQRRVDSTAAPPSVTPAAPAPPVEREPDITAEALQKRLEGPSPPLVAFVSPFSELYTEGHIPGAVYVPINTVKEYFKDKPRDQEVVFYCGCCKGDTKGLSGQAVQFLREMGFEHVVHLLGHMDAWKTAGYPVEKGSGVGGQGSGNAVPTEK